MIQLVFVRKDIEFENKFSPNFVYHALNFFFVGLWGLQIGIFPGSKVPCEVSAQVVSGDYILWNSLGRYPHVASKEDLA